MYNIVKSFIFIQIELIDLSSINNPDFFNIYIGYSFVRTGYRANRTLYRFLHMFKSLSRIVKSQQQSKNSKLQHFYKVLSKDTMLYLFLKIHFQVSSDIKFSL